MWCRAARPGALPGPVLGPPAEDPRGWTWGEPDDGRRARLRAAHRSRRSQRSQRRATSSRTASAPRRLAERTRVPPRPTARARAESGYRPAVARRGPVGDAAVVIRPCSPRAAIPRVRPAVLRRWWRSPCGRGGRRAGSPPTSCRRSPSGRRSDAADHASMALPGAPPAEGDAGAPCPAPSSVAGWQDREALRGRPRRVTLAEAFRRSVTTTPPRSNSTPPVGVRAAGRAGPTSSPRGAGGPAALVPGADRARGRGAPPRRHRPHQPPDRRGPLISERPSPATSRTSSRAGDPVAGRGDGLRLRARPHRVVVRMNDAGHL